MYWDKGHSRPNKDRKALMQQLWYLMSVIHSISSSRTITISVLTKDTVLFMTYSGWLQLSVDDLIVIATFLNLHLTATHFNYVCPGKRKSWKSKGTLKRQICDWIWQEHKMNLSNQNETTLYVTTQHCHWTLCDYDLVHHSCCCLNYKECMVVYDSVMKLMQAVWLCMIQWWSWRK